MSPEFRFEVLCPRNFGLCPRNSVSPEFERPVRLISDFAKGLGVTYGGAMNNINELIAQGVWRR